MFFCLVNKYLLKSNRAQYLKLMIETTYTVLYIVMLHKIR